MPSGPTDTIAKALAELLASAPAGSSGGFVIFDNGNQDEYVQFSVEPEGLLLFWADAGRVSAEEAAKLLDLIPFAHDRHADVKRLRPKSYVLEDNGVYAQFGRDTESVTSFTMRAFSELFGREAQLVRAEVSIES
jgi:hypothetical protein